MSDLGAATLRPVTPQEAMRRALEIAALGPAHGPNPRVGCVLLDAAGGIIGEGHHQGAGTAHAEVDAIANAAEHGHTTLGATAYVTLEPCRHSGRTGPCVDALAEAGVLRVVYAVTDPGQDSGGGAGALEERGVEAVFVPNAEAESLNARFLHAIREGRPYVILKFAATLDGRTAAADGSSLWITGEAARAHAHGERSRADAIIVGTGTVLADDPSLSARPGGHEEGHQPLRVVVGLRETGGKKVWRDGNALRLASHDPAQVLQELAAREVRTAIIEGGATLAAAFLRAGLVDEVQAYLAPVLVGSGQAAVEGLGIQTMSDALRLTEVSTIRVGDDTLVTGLIPRKA